MQQFKHTAANRNPKVQKCLATLNLASTSKCIVPDCSSVSVRVKVSKFKEEYFKSLFVSKLPPSKNNKKLLLSVSKNKCLISSSGLMLLQYIAVFINEMFISILYRKCMRG